MTETNKNGASIERAFYMERERYFYDLKLGKGWKQYDTDQDAPYFGIWVNIEEMKTVTYAEGDEIIVTCPTLEILKAELADMEEYYGEPPPAFKTIDQAGTVTNYYDERPEV